MVLPRPRPGFDPAAGLTLLAHRWQMNGIDYCSAKDSCYKDEAGEPMSYGLTVVSSGGPSTLLLQYKRVLEYLSRYGIR